jgi:hypothetical protein
MKRIMSMRCLRKFVSLVAIAAIGIVPLLSVGCNDQSGGATPTGQTASASPKTDGAPAPAAKKIKKEKKKKPATTTAESGSTTGAGVTPPVK